MADRSDQPPAGKPTATIDTSVGSAQETPPVEDAVPADDWKSSTINQKGKEYPQVNSERRARFRVVAPDAQSVSVSLGKLALTKGEDGAWVGITAPLDEGFHYYSLKIDGAEVPDPNSPIFLRCDALGKRLKFQRRPGPTPLRMSRTVSFGQILFYSKPPDSHHKAFVYTPPGYEQDSAKRYPCCTCSTAGAKMKRPAHKVTPISSWTT